MRASHRVLTPTKNRHETVPACNTSVPRKPFRASFTRACNIISQDLGKESSADETVRTKLATLERLFHELTTYAEILSRGFFVERII